MLDLAPIKARLGAATPGPWHSCADDRCQCPTVMCDHYPVAEITKGPWGDEYPALRFVGETSLDRKVEAYIERIEYGSVSDEQALANRSFIREAPTDIAALIAEVEYLRMLIAGKPADSQTAPLRT